MEDETSDFLCGDGLFRAFRRCTKSSGFFSLLVFLGWLNDFQKVQHVGNTSWFSLNCNWGNSDP